MLGSQRERKEKEMESLREVRVILDELGLIPRVSN